MNTFENPIALSVGIVMRAKNKAGMVRYQILYKDNYGREHTRWSDWMRFDGYKIGDSIPVKSITIPATFGVVSALLEVDGNPQKHVAPYVVPVVAAGIAALFVGYGIGKDHRN